jgi:hypothetical protein
MLSLIQRIAFPDEGETLETNHIYVKLLEPNQH